ncbi:hypothetical protein, partial [Methanoculleus sp.]|uniref:hypothetical protein n=1 Tax=Methanoculleus sp. TaxID=90427 RepID=UPI0025D90460
PPSIFPDGYSPDLQVCIPGWIILMSLFCKTLLHGFCGDIAIGGGADGAGSASVASLSTVRCEGDVPPLVSTII